MAHWLMQYWYVASLVSVAWTLGSLVWTIRAERKFRRLTELETDVAQQELGIRYLQADHDGRDEKTPTSYYPIARRPPRGVH